MMFVRKTPAFYVDEIDGLFHHCSHVSPTFFASCARVLYVSACMSARVCVRMCVCVCVCFRVWLRGRGCVWVDFSFQNASEEGTVVGKAAAVFS